MSDEEDVLNELKHHIEAVGLGLDHEFSNFDQLPDVFESSVYDQDAYDYDKRAWWLDRLVRFIAIAALVLPVLWIILMAFSLPLVGKEYRPGKMLLVWIVLDVVFIAGIYVPETISLVVLRFDECRAAWGFNSTSRRMRRNRAQRKYRHHYCHCWRCRIKVRWQSWRQLRRYKR